MMKHIHFYGGPGPFPHLRYRADCHVEDGFIKFAVLFQHKTIMYRDPGPNRMGWVRIAEWHCADWPQADTTTWHPIDLLSIAERADFARKGGFRLLS
jgi:hypothetical protein